MTDRASGLRFDIYERVHLPDDAAAIEELEEIELVPHLQALSQADQLLLKGHLLLTGIYRSAERSSEPSKLEHRIPVEISLPPNRVGRVEDLAVEIDNFDVDLLSTRSLNVTGVLALRGLQAEAQEPPVWRDDSFTVVHQAQPEEDVGPSSESERSEEEPACRTDEQPAPPVYADESASATQQAGAPEAEALSALADDGASWSSGDWGDITAGKPGGGSEQASEYGNEFEPGNEPQPVSRPEVKVALGVKPAESGTAGAEWLSSLGDKRIDAGPGADAAAVAKAAESRTEPPQPPASTGDELEWTKLFLSAEGDAEPFCKIRMCIVQREDTIEGIAARYNVQPRELQMRNRLNDPYLSEGQVLYIP